MRISDWSSDVCSSDLQRAKLAQAMVADPKLVLLDEPTAGLDPQGRHEMLKLVRRLGTFGISVIMATPLLDDRSEERRVGKECVSTFRSRWSTYPSKKI